jgi:hypothetical protein
MRRITGLCLGFQCGGTLIGFIMIRSFNAIEKTIQSGWKSHAARYRVGVVRQKYTASMGWLSTIGCARSRMISGIGDTPCSITILFLLLASREVFHVSARIVGGW